MCFSRDACRVFPGVLFIGSSYCLAQHVRAKVCNAVAVCVLPGTELAFSSAVSVTESRFLFGEKVETLAYATAIFRQVNKNEQFRHHDALEFPEDALFS
jgi:hypothetical protein